jgi:hypothetical protein
MYLQYNGSESYDLEISGFNREYNVVTGYVENGCWWIRIIESCLVGNVVYAYRDRDMQWLVTTLENAEYELWD